MTPRLSARATFQPDEMEASPPERGRTTGKSRSQGGLKDSVWTSKWVCLV